MISTVRAWALLVMMAVCALAQTQPNIVGQSRGTPGNTWRFFAVSPAGAVMIVELGPSLELDTTGAVPVLNVKLPPPTPGYSEVRKLFVAGSGGVGGTQQVFTIDHTLTQAQTARLKVYRNGILQYEHSDARPGDYTVSGAQVTFTPITLGNGAVVPAVSPGDAIQIIYYL